MSMQVIYVSSRADEALLEALRRSRSQTPNMSLTR